MDRAEQRVQSTDWEVCFHFVAHVPSPYQCHAIDGENQSLGTFLAGSETYFSTFDLCSLVFFPL